MRGTVYGAEVEEIQNARKANPKESAYKLAKQLVGTTGLAVRTFYSIYSVIRRFDAAQKTKKATKKGAKLATAGV